jgi:hypothetical protein
MYRALERAAIWADGQPELDAVCVTGTDRWFGAGGDMGGNAADPESVASERDPTEHFPFRHIERSSKLWVAKVNGASRASLRPSPACLAPMTCSAHDPKVGVVRDLGDLGVHDRPRREPGPGRELVKEVAPDAHRRGDVELWFAE